MTAMEEIVKEAEAMEKAGKSVEEVAYYVDQAIRLSNAVMLAVL